MSARHLIATIAALGAVTVTVHPDPAPVTVETSRGPQDVLVFAARPQTGGGPAAADPVSDAPIILFASGEGGWRAFDTLQAGFLADAGYWVGGVDAMKYFWEAQDDRRALAADFRAMADAVVARAGRPPGWPILLAGFSFGADLAPWVAGGGGWSDRVKGLLMVAPDATGSLEFRLSEILGFRPKEHVFDVSAALAGVAGVPVFFIHGAKDSGAATRALAEAAAEPKKIVVVPGADHHFSGSEDHLRAALNEAAAWLSSQPPAAKP